MFLSLVLVPNHGFLPENLNSPAVVTAVVVTAAAVISSAKCTK